LFQLAIPVPQPVRGGPQEPWGPSRVVREMTPRAPRNLRPIGLGSRGPWVRLAWDMGALAALRGGEGKCPEPPATLWPSGGPYREPRVLFFHSPASGPLGALGASGNQPSWGPFGFVDRGPCMGALGPPGEPEPEPGPKGPGGPPVPRLQGAPGALRSRRDRRWTGGPGPGAYRSGSPWGSTALVTLRERRELWGPEGRPP
jgi:hypothetical protein